MPFNTGDTATGAQAIKFELDIRKDGNFHEMCVNTLSESLNYNVETWTDFCSKGFSSSAMTGLDPEYSAEMIIRYDRSSADLAKIRYDMHAVNNIPMRITNELLNEIVEVNVTITSWNTNYVAEELIKADFTIKPFEGAPTVTRITP